MANPCRTFVLSASTTRPSQCQQIHVRVSQLLASSINSRSRISRPLQRCYASKKTLERKASNQKQTTKPPTTSRVPRPSPASSPAKSHAPIEAHARSIPTPSPPRTPNYLPTTTAYAKTLALRDSATTLYASPPSNSLPVTTTSVSIFCFAYGAYHLYTNFVLPQPDGLWWGIPYAMGGVSILMLALGTWVRGSGRALVGRIEAIPMHIYHRETQVLEAAETPTAKHAKDDTILLRITKKTVFPSFMRLGRPAPTVFADPLSCRLSSRLAQARAQGAYSPINDRNITVQGQRTRVSARDYAALEEGQRDQAKGPFAVFGSMLSAGLAGFGRIVTREGLVPLDAVTLGEMQSTKDAARKPGRKIRWKVDVSDGAYLGDGGLERLMQIK